MQRRFGVVKSGVFALVPVIALLLVGEGIGRLKYFIDHDYDWNYLTAPFRGAEPDVDPVTSVGDNGSSQTQIRSSTGPGRQTCTDSTRFREGRRVSYTTRCSPPGNGAMRTR